MLPTTSDIRKNSFLSFLLVMFSLWLQVHFIALFLASESLASFSSLVFNSEKQTEKLFTYHQWVNSFFGLLLVSIAILYKYRPPLLKRLNYALVGFSFISLACIGFITSGTDFKDSQPLPTLLILLQPLITLVFSVSKANLKVKIPAFGTVIKILTIAMLVFMAFTVWYFLNNFIFSMYDYGMMVQVIHNGAFHNHWFSSMLNHSYWGEHVEPILVIPIAIYRLIPHPFTLAFFQVLCISAATFVLYKLVILKTKSANYASLVAFIFAVSPMVFSAVIFPFHEVIFYPLIVFSIYWCVALKKPKYSILLLLLMLLAVKEDAAFLVCGIGLHLYFTEKKYRWIGLGIIPFALLYLTICMGTIIPYFRGEAFPFFVTRYEDIVPKNEPTILGALKFILSNPNFVIQKVIFNPGKISFLIYLFLPFIPWIKRSVWINYLPLLAMLPLALLSSAPYLYNISQLHLTMMFIPGLMLLFAHVNIQDISSKKNLITFGTSTLLLFHVGGLNSFSLSFFKPLENKEQIHKLLNTIPDEASVCAHNYLGTFLSARERINLYPSDTMNHDYVVFNLNPHIKYWTSIESKREIFVAQAIKLINNGYKIEGRVADIFLLKRSADTIYRRADLRALKSIKFESTKLNSTTAVPKQLSNNINALVYSSANLIRNSVFFGPYIGLEAGNYELKITYLFTGNPETYGHLRIVDSGTKTELKSLTFPLKTSQSQQVLNIPFSVPRGAEVFESPLEMEGIGQLQIIGYQIDAQ